MSSVGLVESKATSDRSRSDAVVVSFGSEWYEPLRRLEFRLVIRKRVPVTMSPRWMYLHVNAPRSAICARGVVQSVGMLDLSSALRRAEDIRLPEAAIREYFLGQASVGCYELGQVLLLPREVATSEIRTRMVYHPPQSFMILSRDGKSLLDELCGFPPRPAEGQGK